MTQDQPEKVGAVRPTGKRQLAGVSTTSTASMEAKKSAPQPEEKGNAVARFLPEVVEEMRKVIWPTARQMLNYTLITFAFLIFVTALVAGVDFVAGLGVEKVLTN